MYTQMANPSVVISAENAGRGGSGYFFDDAEEVYAFGNSGLEAKNEVLKANAQASIDYRARTDAHISNAANVSGYQTWGFNGNQGAEYSLNGSVVFTGRSNWYVMETV